MNKLGVGLLAVVAFASLAGNALLYFNYSSQRPLIDVNNQVIRRKDLQDRLDYQYSTNILRQMILADLIQQAAMKAGVWPLDADVAREKSELQRSHPELIEAAQEGGSTFDSNLKTEIALRSLRLQNVNVSGAEVARYYQFHRAEFKLPHQVSTTLVVAADSEAAQTAANLLSTETSLQVIAEQSGLRVAGVSAPPITTLPVPIKKSIMLMKAGQVRTFPVGSSYLVVQVKQVAAGGVPPLKLVEPQVELAAKLAKAPTSDAELAKILQSSTIKVESSKYAGAVPQIGANIAAQQGQ